MNARFKKWLMVTLKIAILVGIIEYARRQSQLDDEIAIPHLAATSLAEWAARGGATGTVRGDKIVLFSPEGHPVEVLPGARLRVIGEPATSGNAGPGSALSAPHGAQSAGSYTAETKGGDRVLVAAGDVEGSPFPKERDGAAPFALLPGMRSLFHHLDFGYVALAFGLFGPALLLMAVRWQVLLRASSIDIPFGTIARLHYMGFFLNSFMPGGRRRRHHQSGLRGALLDTKGRSRNDGAHRPGGWPPRSTDDGRRRGPRRLPAFGRARAAGVDPLTVAHLDVGALFLGVVPETDSLRSDPGQDAASRDLAAHRRGPLRAAPPQAKPDPGVWAHLDLAAARGDRRFVRRARHRHPPREVHQLPGVRPHRLPGQRGPHQLRRDWPHGRGLPEALP